MHVFPAQVDLPLELLLREIPDPVVFPVAQDLYDDPLDVHGDAVVRVELLLDLGQEGIPLRQGLHERQRLDLAAESEKATAVVQREKKVFIK